MLSRCGTFSLRSSSVTDSEESAMKLPKASSPMKRSAGIQSEECEAVNEENSSLSASPQSAASLDNADLETHPGRPWEQCRMSFQVKQFSSHFFQASRTLRTILTVKRVLLFHQAQRLAPRHGQPWKQMQLKPLQMLPKRRRRRNTQKMCWTPWIGFWKKTPKLSKRLLSRKSMLLRSLKTLRLLRSPKLPIPRLWELKDPYEGSQDFF
ncbi:hypothetical protein L596_001393 [Steinernema carpocapsae]|uniref:Uncharacterized protein n=1 Tax=Steinernema carpocapsae TaxID=34508 RepID=A0A4U8ULM8_STECR|nr:hypothetical protein L596_001393 [Steinernema carpocapsae]